MDFLRDVVSGAIGAVCCVYAGLPLDTLKIRMQLGSSRIGTDRGLNASSSASTSASASASQSRPTLRTTFHAVLKEEGWRALFKGATPALASAMIENSVVFAANGVFTRLAHDWLANANANANGNANHKDTADELPFVAALLVDGASGFCSATAICAPEVVKCKLQMDKAPLTAATARKAVLSIYRSDGVAGFAKGMQALWMRDVPFYLAFFGAYSALTRGYKMVRKSWNNNSTANANANASASANANANGSGSGAYHGTIADKEKVEEEVPLFFCWVNGGLAGSFAWATVFPVDVVKSLQQTSDRKISVAKVSRCQDQGRLRRCPCI